MSGHNNMRFDSMLVNQNHKKTSSVFLDGDEEDLEIQ